MLTWDERQQRYIGYIVTSRSEGCTLVSGNWEGQNLVLSGEFEFNETKVRFREVSSDISAEGMTLRQYNSVEEAAAQLFGTARFEKE